MAARVNSPSIVPDTACRLPDTHLWLCQRVSDMARAAQSGNGGVGKTSSIQLYQLLYKALLSGELKPGDRIRENEIAARYNVSRTPVREALGRLEAQGLLVYGDQRGLVVPRLDAQSATELYVMREVLDATAARLAAKHANAAEVASLRHMVERDAQNVEDVALLVNTNRIFHSAICDCAHNRFLKRMQETMAESLALLGPTTLSLPNRSRSAIEEHAAIVEAIAVGDGDAAAAAASRHSVASHQARLELIYAESQGRARTAATDR